MSRLSKALILGLLTGILGLIASLVPSGIEVEERIGLDLLFKLRGVRAAPADVIIVALDKVSAEKFNLPADPQKWPRSLHARLTDSLMRKGAAVIAFDIVFDEADSLENDSLFATSLSRAGNVVLVEWLIKDTVPLGDEHGRRIGVLNIEKLVAPIAPLAQVSIALAPFPLPKVPVRMSQYWTFKTGAGDTPTLPVVVLQIFALDVYDHFVDLLEKVSPLAVGKLPPTRDAIMAAKGAEKLVQALRDIFVARPAIAEEMLQKLEDSREVFLDAKTRQILKSLIRMYQSPDSLYLNFYGPPGTITTISYYQALEADHEPVAQRNSLDFRGKAVFVGLSERLRPEQKDGFYTVFSQASGLDVSGVEIAATAFANLLEEMPVRPLYSYTHIAIVLLWGVALGVLCRLIPTLFAALSVAGLSVLYLLFARYQFNYAGIWYPLVFPLLIQAPFAFFVTVLWKHFDTTRERQSIRKAFRYYLPAEVVDQIVENIADIKSGGRVVYGTCLMTDAEQYTTLSETMEPKELSGLLNNYYEALFQPVRRRGGIVSDIKGDSMMAIWTTTHPDAAMRSQACRAALEIISAVTLFNKSSEALQLPTRIGLHSGQMLLGHIGAVDHYEYRAVGDIVNTVSRIENLNKQLGTRILASAEVLYQLDGFLSREIGRFLLSGKSNPVTIHELLCLVEECSGLQRELCKVFAQALRAYQRQSWEVAIEKFQECMRLSPEDGPSHFYVEMCAEYVERPPGEDWDGLVSLDKS